jgi:hypothetical protein
LPVTDRFPPVMVSDPPGMTVMFPSTRMSTSVYGPGVVVTIQSPVTVPPEVGGSAAPVIWTRPMGPAVAAINMRNAINVRRCMFIASTITSHWPWGR